MREELVETLVKRKTNIGLKIGMMFLYILCGLVVLAGLGTSSFLVILAGAVLGVLGWFVGSRSQVEYEYTYCDKEIDIDVIYNQTNRKRVITLDMGKMEALVRVNSAKMGEFKNRQLIQKDYSSKRAENAEEVYAIIYEGGTMFLIEPGERLLNALSYVCPRKIFKN